MIEESTFNESVRLSGNTYKLQKDGIQKPGPGEVLIKVAFSSVNPVDRQYIISKPIKDKPIGSEGSGTIIDVGDEELKKYKGRKVSFI